ncbi:MAG: hypothetical protein KF683_08885 [Rubrivivax sp.]|nr:hypothetical protein [Rubrivivax sp.]
MRSRRQGALRAIVSAAALAATTCIAAPPARGVAAVAPAAAPAPARAQHWTAWGGTVGVRWNRELARDLGIVIGEARGRHPEPSWFEHEVFDLRQQGAIEFDVQGGNLAAFVGGVLQARGGHVLDTSAGRIDLTDFRLVPRRGEALRLDLVDAEGRAWFYVDRLMYELVDGGQRLAVRTMDLRIAPELARRIGQPEVADWVIADMELSTEVLKRGSGDMTPLNYVYRWDGLPVPGVPGARYEADLFMQTFSTQYSRCNGCTGAGGNGDVVFTPSSTLRNNVNNGSMQVTVANDPLGTSAALYAADIPWYSKFSGNFPPHDNDQHPYLIWNLYRLNADGSIEQIGRSGVKHAFLTINVGCLENPNDSHVLGRGCSDTYSVSNNDASNALGPRSEIIPATGQWGRCGSIYDTNCDGVPNASGNGVYDQRLVVRESQFSGAAQAGATYLFESWYLARGDIAILNSMATKRATFTRSGSVWVVGGNDQYRLGPAIDRWVDPANPGPGAASVQIGTPEGHVKVASRATDLGGGRWRYDYAVMNLDFARAQTERQRAQPARAEQPRAVGLRGAQRRRHRHRPGLRRRRPGPRQRLDRQRQRRQRALVGAGRAIAGLGHAVPLLVHHRQGPGTQHLLAGCRGAVSRLKSTGLVAPQARRGR